MTKVFEEIPPGGKAPRHNQTEDMEMKIRYGSKSVTAKKTGPNEYTVTVGGYIVTGTRQMVRTHAAIIMSGATPKPGYFKKVAEVIEKPDRTIEEREVSSSTFGSEGQTRWVVTVNGKFIGSYQTLEEAENAKIEGAA
jgi:hypothetical protein